MTLETKDRRTLERLMEELQRLKEKYGYGLCLKVRYVPREGQKRGEVVGDTLHIYDKGLGDAVETLRHEYLDHCLTKEIIEPLVDQVNLLTSLLVKQVYRRKEELIERFSAAI